MEKEYIKCSSTARDSFNFFESQDLNMEREKLLQYIMKKRGAPQSQRIFSSSPKSPVVFSNIFVKKSNALGETKKTTTNENNEAINIENEQNKNRPSNIPYRASENYPVETTANVLKHAKFFPTASSTPQQNLLQKTPTVSPISSVKRIPSDRSQNSAQKSIKNKSIHGITGNNQTCVAIAKEILNDFGVFPINDDDDDESDNGEVVNTSKPQEDFQNLLTSDEDSYTERESTGNMKKGQTAIEKLGTESVRKDNCKTLTASPLVTNKESNNEQQIIESDFPENGNEIFSASTQGSNVSETSPEILNVPKPTTTLSSRSMHINDDQDHRNNKSDGHQNHREEQISDDQNDGHQNNREEQVGKNENDSHDNHRTEHISKDQNDSRQNSREASNNIDFDENPNSENTNSAKSPNQDDIFEPIQPNTQPEWLTEMIEKDRKKNTLNTRAKEKATRSRRIKKQVMDPVKQSYLEAMKSFTATVSKKKNLTLNSTRRTLYTKGRSQEPESDIEESSNDQINRQNKNTTIISNKGSRILNNPTEIPATPPATSNVAVGEETNLKIPEPPPPLPPQSPLKNLKDTRNVVVNLKRLKSYGEINNSTINVESRQKTKKNIKANSKPENSARNGKESENKKGNNFVQSKNEINKEKQSNKISKSSSPLSKKTKKNDCENEHISQLENTDAIRRSSRPRCPRIAYWTNNPFVIEESVLWQDTYVGKKSKNTYNKKKIDKKSIHKDEKKSQKNNNTEDKKKKQNKKSKNYQNHEKELNHINAIPEIESNKEEEIIAEKEIEKLNKNDNDNLPPSNKKSREEAITIENEEIINRSKTLPVDKGDDKNLLKRSNRKRKNTDINSTFTICINNDKGVEIENCSNANYKNPLRHDHDEISNIEIRNEKEKEKSTSEILTKSKSGSNQLKNRNRVSKKILTRKRKTPPDSGNASDDDDDDNDSDGSVRRKSINQSQQQQKQKFDFNWLEKLTSNEWDFNSKNNAFYANLVTEITKCTMDDIKYQKDDNKIEYAFYTSDCGYIRILPNYEKKLTKQKYNELKFVICHGNPSFYIEDKIMDCKAGDLMKIKKGVTYGIKNDSNQVVLLNFFRT